VVSRDAESLPLTLLQYFPAPPCIELQYYYNLLDPSQTSCFLGYEFKGDTRNPLASKASPGIDGYEFLLRQGWVSEKELNNQTSNEVT